MMSAGNSKLSLVVLIFIIAWGALLLVKRANYEKQFEVTPAERASAQARDRGRAEARAKLDSIVEAHLAESEITDSAVEQGSGSDREDEPEETTPQQEKLIAAVTQYSSCIGYFRFRAKSLLDDGASASDYAPWVERQERFERYREMILDELGFSETPAPARNQEMSIFQKLSEFSSENPELAEKQYLETHVWDPQCTETDREILSKYGNL